MLSRSFIASIFLIASISSANAHAGVSPALGVKGQLTRNDVQRPSANSPCGNVNVAQNLDSSTAVPADANGNFSPTITDFNGGADGSRSIKTVQVDASGTGKNLVAAKMVVNGNANPTSVGTDQLTAQLPAGTKCTGGAQKNLCLVSFTTTAGFGNCVVVSQGAAASNPPALRSTSGQSILPRNGAAKGVNSSTSSHAAGDAQASPKAKNENGKKDDKKGNDNKKGNVDASEKGDKNAKDVKKGSVDVSGSGKADKKAQDNKKAKDDKGKGGKKGSVDVSQSGKADKKAQDDKKAKDNKGKAGKKGSVDVSQSGKANKKVQDDKKAKGDKKGKGGKKGSVDVAQSGKANKQAQDDKKAKDVKKGKGGKKGSVDVAQSGKGDQKAKDNKKNGKNDAGKKKGDKKNVKQANKKAQGTPPAADGNNRRRSWSSRPMGKFA